METLLTPPVLDSAEEAARFIDDVLAQATSLRAQMQVADRESARLAAETQDLRAETARLQVRLRQAAGDMDAALDGLSSLAATR